MREKCLRCAYSLLCFGGVKKGLFIRTCSNCGKSHLNLRIAYEVGVIRQKNVQHCCEVLGEIRGAVCDACYALESWKRP